MIDTPQETVLALNNTTLAELLTKHPDYRLVTDVGMSMCSGWGDIDYANIHHDAKIIELVFR